MGAQHIKPPIKASVSDNNIISPGDMFSKDLAQSRFFTVTIDKLPANVINGNIEALAVKSISYTITGIEAMVLPIGIFKDIPIPTGKKLPRIDLVLTDDRTDLLESKLRNWFNDMVPSGEGIVGYLDSMVAVLIYTSYDTSGTVNFSYRADVMLADDLSMSRSYEANELKTIGISLIVLEDNILVNNNFNKLSKPEPLPVNAPKQPGVLTQQRNGVIANEPPPRVPMINVKNGMIV